jgi:hypothetical protein
LKICREKWQAAGVAKITEYSKGTEEKKGDVDDGEQGTQVCV